MANPDPEKEQYYEEMRQRRLEYQKKYDAEHPSRLEYQRKYHREHPSPPRKHPDRYRKTHKEWWNAISRNNYDEARAKLFDIYGARCSCCGISTKTILQLHHVKGNGKKERQHGGPIGDIKRAIAAKDPKAYMILCPTCHSGIHKNHGVCPVHENSGRERASNRSS